MGRRTGGPARVIPAYTERDVIRAIERAPNGVVTAIALAYELGYRPSHAGALAVAAKLRRMERIGKVHSFRPGMRGTDSLHWGVSR